MIRFVGSAYVLLSGCSVVLFSLLAKTASTVGQTVMLGIAGTLFSSVVFILGVALIMETSA
jgi:hypothetical protein